jgi:hypothetical protein
MLNKNMCLAIVLSTLALVQGGRVLAGQQWVGVCAHQGTQPTTNVMYQKNAKCQGQQLTSIGKGKCIQVKTCVSTTGKRPCNNGCIGEQTPVNSKAKQVRTSGCIQEQGRQYVPPLSPIVRTLPRKGHCIQEQAPARIRCKVVTKRQQKESYQQ